MTKDFRNNNIDNTNTNINTESTETARTNLNPDRDIYSDNYYGFENFDTDERDISSYSEQNRRTVNSRSAGTKKPSRAPIAITVVCAALIVAIGGSVAALTLAKNGTKPAASTAVSATVADKTKQTDAKAQKNNALPVSNASAVKSKTDNANTSGNTGAVQNVSTGTNTSNTNYGGTAAQSTGTDTSTNTYGNTASQTTDANINTYGNTVSQTTDTDTNTSTNTFGSTAYQPAAAAVTGTPCYHTVYGSASYGYDWKYVGGSGIIKIDCTYDFNAKAYTFTFTGLAPGQTSLVLYHMEQTDNGNEWVPENLNFTVDSALNVYQV